MKGAYVASGRLVMGIAVGVVVLLLVSLLVAVVAVVGWRLIT